MCLLVAGSAAAWPVDVRASLRFSDDQLARSSAAAVRGHVVAVQPHVDAATRALYTLVTIDVEASWGLDGQPARVVVKQLGGVIGTTALAIGGQATFVAGEYVLVLLDVRPRDRTLYVAGLAQGKFSVPDLAAPHGDTAGRAPFALDALAALAGTRVRAGAVDLSGGLRATANRAVDMTADFSLLSPLAPARWHEADSRAAIYVDSQVGGHPRLPGGGIDSAVAATAAWNVNGTLALRPGVFRGPRCFAHGEAADGRISITYDDPCGEIADDSLTLAIGGAYFSSADARVVNGVRFWRITAGMIVTDNAAGKFDGMSPGCYGDLLAHELGHAIGFGHSSSAGAVMFPTLSPACAARASGQALHADDLAALALVYPQPGPPPPGAPNGLGAAVSNDVVRFFWGQPLWGAPATAYRLEAGSAPGLSNLGVRVTAATESVFAGVPNGVYHVRVRALAGAAPGPPTPEIVVTVGGPPPGAPQQLTALTGAGGHVHLSWQPPAGAVTRYVVEVGYGPGHTAHRFTTAEPRLAAAAVPPGTYHVRVVAMNGTSAGPASPEIVLVARP